MFLFAGGVIFLVYFWSIHFMPEIDAKAFVTLLAASALTGGCLFIFMSVCWVFPGYMWMGCTRHLERLKSPLWFFLPMLGVVLSFLLSAFWMPKWVWVAPLLVIPIASLPLFFSFGKVLDWISASSRRCLESLKRLRNRGFIETLKTVGGFYLGLIFSIFFFIPLFIIIYSIIRRDSDINHSLASVLTSIIFGSLCILSSNVILIKFLSKYKNDYKAIAQCIIVGVASFFIMLVMLRALPCIPERVMNIYKFGNFSNAFLVFDEVGCSIAQHHGIKPTPLPPNPTMGNSSSPPKITCSLPKVTIHSRLGSTFYLEAFLDEKTSVRFTIPGQNVLSWAVNESKAVK